MSGILEKLKGGDLRSIGRADEVVHDILENPALFGEVFEGMLSAEPIIRMRAADALEKVSSKHPEYLQPFKTRLIDEVSGVKQQEVRWHVAQMFSYLDINKSERDKIVEILLSYLNNERSRIVKVFSIQTLADLAHRDEAIKPMVAGSLKEVIKSGSPAIVSRAKKLLTMLKSNQ